MERRFRIFLISWKFGEMLFLSLFLFNGALVLSAQTESGSGTPENVTVQLIDSKTVEVFWSTTWKNVERYDITYNPTEDRVVSQAAGSSRSVVLRELRPNTQYQVTVTAVVAGKNYKSRRLVFRTSQDPNDTLELEEIHPVPTRPTKRRKAYPVTPEVINPDPTAVGSKYTPPTSTTVRGVEIGLVLLALVVWIIAIALFFHRWGKIRMLLPYQPDYKTQQSLKVPGTGTTIVSGCTGNSTAQGQQEGPGCVQHLRWSSRYFDEPSTAKKCSPAKWTLKSRVSSAIFPTSPSFLYTRTSAECESPRMMRHAHSHSEFPTEDIVLCQVNQPRSDKHDNIISINVPVIASTVNETKRTGDHKRPEKKRNSDDDITKLEESDFCKKDSKEKSYLSCLDETDKKSLGLYCPLSFYQRNSERSERKKEKEKCPESEPLFFVESEDVPEPEKPRRYNRSSLKKQKVRVYDDRDIDACKNVPIIEVRSQDSSQAPQEVEPEKKPDPKVLKTVEMRRKAFLRKISLQDTYLNYNQDYWLGSRKSGRFHKSIDLGYFGSDVPGPKPDVSNRTSEDCHQAPVDPPQIKSNQTSAITRQSKLPLNRGPVWRLRRSGSDPVIRSDKKHSCKNCGYVSRNESSELLTEVIAKCESGQKKSNWFCSPSNENIPLFSERNGRIETDFDVLDEEGFLSGRLSEIYQSPEDHRLPAPVDFSDFYEIKLTSEYDRKSTAAFFDETLTSMSGDSDIFYETEPIRMSEEGRQGFSSYLDRSSTSPPKPSPSYT